MIVDNNRPNIDVSQVFVPHSHVDSNNSESNSLITTISQQSLQTNSTSNKIEAIGLKSSNKRVILPVSAEIEPSTSDKVDDLKQIAKIEPEVNVKILDSSSTNSENKPSEGTSLKVKLIAAAIFASAFVCFALPPFVPIAAAIAFTSLGCALVSIGGFYIGKNGKALFEYLEPPKKNELN